MAGHIDMSEAKRGEMCDIFIIQCFTLRPEMILSCQLIFLIIGISVYYQVQVK